MFTSFPISFTQGSIGQVFFGYPWSYYGCSGVLIKVSKVIFSFMTVFVSRDPTMSSAVTIDYRFK